MPPVRPGCLLALLLMSAVCGCGRPDDPDKPQPVPTAGQVLLGDKPLAGATVTFLALDGRVSCNGVTDDRGEFALSTYDPNDGAPPGKYKVIVSTDEFDVVDGRPVPKPGKRTGPPVPGKYSRPSDSPLTAEVTAAGPNRFRFPLNLRFP